MSRRNRRSTRATRQEAELDELHDSITQANSPRRVQDGDANMPLIEELVNRLGHVQVPDNRPAFKPPKYDGSTDVEMFILQFNEVSRANRWSYDETLLHLRSCLEGPALECGRERRTADVLQSLQTRFGMTPKQARDQLKGLRKKPKQSYHELGSEINKLVEIAYCQETQGFRTLTCLETFSHAVQHRGLRQHLLARPHDSIAEAVAIANEFMRIEGPTPTLASLETPSQETTPPSELTTLVKLMAEQQALLVELLQQTKTAPIQAKKKGPCFICSGEHWKRECPHAGRSEEQWPRRADNSQTRRPTTPQERNHPTGNAQGLAQ